MAEITEDFLRTIAAQHNVSEDELRTLHLALVGQTAEKIAATLGNIKASAVRKRLKSVYEKFGLPLEGTAGKLEVLRGILKEQYQSVRDVSIQPLPDVGEPLSDFGEAPDVSVFYGRAEALKTLEAWIIQDRCRLIAILGMGGIGKTTLSVKLAQLIEGQFEYVIWRSLKDAPPFKQLLTSLTKVFSKQQDIDTDSSETPTDSITQLLEFLRSHRCLLILDNVESILQAGKTGVYRAGYEGYGELLKRVGESSHQSCLIITSREKPRTLAALEGEILPVRCWQMYGIEAVSGREILKAKGLQLQTEEQGKELIRRCAGNPLALKLIATTIQELFSGNVAEFLKQETIALNEIRVLLDQHFDRLSSLEQSIMYWLAINREPVTVQELLDDIIPPVLKPRLLEALTGLIGRSLIEKTLEKAASSFTQQPVVMEYAIERLVEQICDEISHHDFHLFHNHALIKAIAKDYVRESQIRLILQPVAAYLTARFSKAEMGNWAIQALSNLRHQSLPLRNYAAGNVINLLCQLGIDLTGYNLSHLVIRQADLQGIRLPHVDFSYSDLSQSTCSEPFSSALSLAFGCDGQLLAAGDANGVICLWQVSQFQQVSVCKGHTNRVWSLVFSPDGQILASGSEDKTVKIWEPTTGECLTTLQGHTSRVWSVAFSPDGQTLASGSDDQTIKLWNVYTGECLQTFKGHHNWVCSVAFSPDGQRLASGSEDQTIKLWDVPTGECLHTLQGHTKRVNSVRFSPDGQLLASGSEDQTVNLWNPLTGKCIKALEGHRDRVWSVAFSPNGQTLTSSGEDKTVRLWNLTTGECFKILGHANRVWSVAFSPDGQLLASSGEDKTVKLWDPSIGECLKTFRGYTNKVWSVAFSADGQTLASGSEDQTVKLWNVATGECLRSLEGHASRIWSVVFSPSGQLLASSSDDQTVKLWNLKTGKCKTLSGHTNWVFSVAFSPNGQLLASGSEDQTIKLWHPLTGRCLQTLHGYNGKVWSVAFSPDGATLASGGENQTIQLWNLASGEPLATLEGHTNRVWSVAFSPNGQLLASGSEDQTIKLWNAATGECLRTLRGHRDRVWSIAFSPDSQLLASGSDDQTVNLWDTGSGECLITLEGHTNWVRSVAFSPDGKILASSGEDEIIILWNLKTGKSLKKLRSAKLYEGMNITGVIGLTEAQKAALKALGATDGE
ncbi:NACHT domain-containing protein [Oculatella sp. LEGE 06141]|uniref:WD40 domain-containing protein n=1 Tax=Oculatella sp. LEGE 06141 TaxID=1828648 RepID=UPI00188064DD|nr:NACHT domain-containing protein [Oculatella sp. LEGE 06141]